MKKYLIVIMCATLVLSCSRQKGVQKSASELNSVPVQASTSEKATGEEPIVEIEERVVEIEEETPDDYLYFVIIGSFRNKENAMSYQEDIGEEGFSAVLLRNDAGLYRVSVKATDDISAARNEIRRIRENYPEHQDTWLLIRKK